MFKKMKKAIVLLLTLAMVCTLMPSSMFATESESESTNETTADESAVTEETTSSEAEEEYVLEYSDDDIEIVIEYDEDAAIPEDAELVVTEVADEEKEGCIELLNAERVENCPVGSIATGYDPDDVIVYDISIIYEGEEIEPEATVEVSMSFSEDALEELESEETEDLVISHIEDEEIEEVEITEADDGTVTFETDSFSQYAAISTNAVSDLKVDFSGLGIEGENSTLEKSTRVVQQWVNGQTAFCGTPHESSLHNKDKITYISTAQELYGTTYGNKISQVIQAYDAGSNGGIYIGSGTAYNFALAQALVWSYAAGVSDSQTVSYNGETVNALYLVVIITFMQVFSLTYSAAEYVLQYWDTENTSATGYSSGYAGFSALLSRISTFTVCTAYAYRCEYADNCVNNSDSEHQYNICLFYYPNTSDTGYLNIKKVSSDTDTTDDNDSYSLKGVQYAVYSSESDAEDDDNRLHTFTINEDGSSDGKVELDVGTYYVKEVTAGTNYDLDDTIYTVTVTADTTTWVNGGTVYDSPVTGYAKLIKEANITDDTVIDNSCYSLTGAVYRIYTSDGTYTGKTFTVSTYSSDRTYATSNTVELPLGSYYAQEYTSSSGYSKDTTKYTFTVTSSNTTTAKAKIVTATEYTYPDVPEIILYKTDEYGNRLYVSGVKFSLTYKYKDSDGNTQTETYIYETDSKGKIDFSDPDYLVSGSPYTDSSGTIAFFASSVIEAITIEETDPPTGYESLNAALVYSISVSSGVATMSLYSGSTTFNAAGYYINKPAISSSGYIYWPNKTIRGGAEFYKIDADRDTAVAQGEATLEGAVITIYNISDEHVYITSNEVESGVTLLADANNDHYYEYGEAVAQITTDIYGHATMDGDGDGEVYTLSYGSYYARETTPSTGYLLNDDWIVYWDVTEDGVIYGNSDFTNAKGTKLGTSGSNLQEEDITGGVVFGKADAEETDYLGIDTYLPLGAATLEGAVIAIVNASDPAESIYDGAVYIPKSQVEDSDYITYVEDANGDGWYEVGETILLLTTYYYDYDDDGTDEIIATTDGNHDGVCYTLPYGTYYAYEYSPSEGYNLTSESDWSVTFSIDFDEEDDGDVVNLIDSDPLYEYVLRTDFYLTKKDTESDSIAGVLFQITSLTTGETHYFVTDENGYFSSAFTNTAHTESNANLNDEAISYESTGAEDEYVTLDADGNTIYVDESKLSSDYGIWFGVDTAPDSSLGGALPYDKYKVTEIRISANEEYQVMAEFTFTTMLYDDGYTLDLGTLINNDMEVVTNVLNLIDDTQIATATERINLQDTVTITNTEDGAEYKISAWLVVADTEEQFGDYSATLEFEGTGQTVSRYITFKNVDLTGMDGEEIVVYVEVYRYDEDTASYLLMASEKSSVDRDETIYIPSIATTALDQENSTHVGSVSEEVTLTETISFTNLLWYQWYTAVGILYDAETGEPIVIDGQYVSATTTFYQTGESVYGSDGSIEIQNGEVELTFTFDSTGLTDKTLVVYAYIYKRGGTDTIYDYDGKTKITSVGDLVASEEDIENADESVHIPDISSAAADSETGDRVGTNGDEVTIVDTIYFVNLLGGHTYKAVASLVDKVTGEEIECDAYTQFSLTANGSISVTSGESGKITSIDDDDGINGNVTVTITSSGIEDGDTVVVYETLYILSGGEWYELCDISDIDDLEETVYYPYIYTQAYDINTTDDVGKVDEDATIVDTVYFENLLIGQEYTITGTLYNRTDGTILTIDGETITQSVTVTIDDDGTASASDGESIEIESITEDGQAASGTATVTFNIDSSDLGDVTVVVYEALIHNNSTVAVHKEINDDSESIHYPEIDTEAYDYYTGDHVGTVFGQLIAGIRTLLGDDDVDGDGITDDVQENLLDTVSLYNLVPGRTYTLVGSLMYEETEEAVDLGDGAITETVIFTVSEDGESITIDSGNAEDAEVTAYNTEENSIDAEITLIFSVDTSQTEDATLVVYEQLYHNTLVAVHEDATDADQQIQYTGIETHASDQDTYDHVGAAGDTQTITDIVSLTNLIIGETYTVTGYPVYQKDFTDADGNEHKAGDAVEFDEDASTYMVEFTATAEDMEIELTYVIDSTLLSGTTVVVFEDLYHKGIKINTHTDIESHPQSIFYPAIATSAADVITGDDVGAYSEDDAIIDTVTLTNLLAGNTYVIKGVIMDQSDESILSVGGNTITKEVTVTVSEDGKITVSDGETATVTAYDEDNGSVDATVTVTFEGIDSTLLSGETAVIYERLYHAHEDCGDECWMTETEETDEILVAEHTELLDINQSIHYPAIDTQALDSDTGSHVGSIWGTLINGIRSLFGNTDTDGNDIEDDRQQNITDTVELTNLVPGKTYTMTGKLMDKDTEEALLINGEEICQEVTFTVAANGKSITIDSGNADNAVVTSYDSDKNSVNATIDVTYSFDSSLLDNEAKTIVVFEDLYHEGKLVAIHYDIDDDDQSINEVSITTTAVDSETNDQVGTVAKESTIIDTVKMEKLVTGETYTITGYLIDTSESTEDNIVYLTNSDGTEISSTVTFTANSDDGSFIIDEENSDDFSVNGSIKMSFTFSNELVQGKSVTVYEELYNNGVLIAVHGFSYDEDGNMIIDSEQSVYYPTGKTNATDNDTDVHLSDTDTVTTITDRVYFQNLVIGEEYTITGTLHYQEDFTDAHGVTHYAGEEVSAVHDWEYTETFTYTCSCGETFSTEEEAQTHAEEEHVIVAARTYSSIDEEGNIVFGTTTYNCSCGESITTYTYDDVLEHINATHTIGSTVETAYVCSVCGATADEIADEYAYTSSVTFTAAETIDGAEDLIVTTLADGTQVVSGYINIVFTIDSSALEGTTIVTFEDFYHNGTKIYSHEDITDTPQTIRFMKMGTSALSDTGINEVSSRTYDEETGEYAWNIATIIDTVSYENIWTQEELDALAEDALLILNGDVEDLRDGEVYSVTEYATYAINGYLVYADSGEEVIDNDGNRVEAYIIFTPENSDGTAEVVYTIDFSKFVDEDGFNYLEGQTLVVYEDFYHINKEEKDASENDMTEENHIGEHKDITDEGQTIYIPKVTTSLGDITDGEADALAEEEITLVDTVSYENLTVGNTYTVTGVLYDEETGEKLLDDEGNEITATQTFVCETEDGEIELTFTFSGVSLTNKTIVAFETVTTKDIPVAVHADIEATPQTVYIPEIGTTLTDEEDGEHDALADEEITLIDTVEYTNLLPYNEYTVKGILYDQKTGEPILDDEGNEITAYTTFTPETPDGAVEVVFTFSGVSLAGESVVAFEYLYRGEKLVAVHTEIDDEGQTVDIPDGRTTLTSDEYSKMALASEDITLIDIVVYENLIIGKTYTVTGTLMDKETGEPMLDDEGNEITASNTFTAESENGSVQIAFTFSGVSLAGKSVVAFEYMYNEKGKLVFVHADIEDEDQTVYIPRIGTTASDSNGSKYATSGAVANIIDVVEYENLVPGVEYTVTGTLMYKSTGEAVLDSEGNEITSSVTFTPEESDGSVEMAFTVQANTCYGAIVVFEEIMEVTTKAVIAAHKDINDEDQTVYFPRIGTTLTDEETAKTVTSGETITLIDTVEYEDLETGQTYRMVGTLVDKSTGITATDSNGEEITAETEFVCEESSGIIEVIFEFESEDMEGYYVAFEKLYKIVTDDEGNEITLLYARHEDIDDEAQTIRLVLPDIPETGDAFRYIIWAGAVAAAAAAAYMLQKTRRRKKTG